MPLLERPTHDVPLAPKTLLNSACAIYLERRKQYLRPRSFEAYHYHFRTLQSFFDPGKRLSSFHEGDFRAYQKWRAKNGAGPSLINHELGALAQLLDLADLWHPIRKYYERLPDRNWAPPKVLTAEEEDRFFRFAARNKEWRTAYSSARITSNSTIMGCELRTLRLEHLRLHRNPPRILVPETVKNRHRVRGVPLNNIALAAMRDLIELAKERGCNEPQHYLIPFRVKMGLYDPCRPASPCFIRAAFRTIARACGLPWVTPRTFRHQAITKLLESGAPDETVRAIAGHVSEKAMKYYSHIRIEAKKAAVDRLGQSTKAPKKSSSKSATSGSFPLLAELNEAAKRLQILPEAALELVLEYERSKSLSK
jgi:integrase